ncbi:MAG: nitroreductase family protein [Pirellulales bacterium]|nr:nitroreductase family protein [Pirellulales bacterium]
MSPNMTVKELLLKNRSYRRFQQTPIEAATLIELVELTRLCPSAANRQPLRYLLTCTPVDNAKVFENLSWAGALPDWPGPNESERPTGYITILGDTEVTERFNVDPGIVAQSMLLGAVERGLGGCILGSITRDGLRKSFSIPDRYAILLVIALGVPGETVVLEDAKDTNDLDYWRDTADVHHVPKRPLSELLVEL